MKNLSKIFGSESSLQKKKIDKQVHNLFSSHFLSAATWKNLMSDWHAFDEQGSMALSG